MKKTTLPKYSKKISQYAALAAAMAGISEAEGQGIEYTPVEPDFVGGNGTSVGLDLDNDGNNDFAIIGSTAPAVGIYGLAPGNSFLGSQLSYIYPFALNFGDAISSGRTIWFDSANSNVGTLNYASCYGGIGGSNWCGVTDKFLGLRFQISGATHYGWVLMDVSASGDSYTIKEYAYNTVAEQSITAGQQTPLGINETNFTDIRIVALNKSIGLYNVPENTDYVIYSMTGQTVLKGSVLDKTHAIEANSLSTGIYILELKDKNSNAVIRKKVII